MQLKPCIFVDRDGVLNKERGAYTYKIADFEIPEGVGAALKLAKQHGYLLIVITNQGGVAKGLYSLAEVYQCHEYLQQQTGSLIDDIYVAHQHPDVSESLLRKPDSLMFEKAIAKHGIDASKSWMVGDSSRDLIAAAKLGIKGYYIRTRDDYPAAKNRADSLLEAVRAIVECQ